MKWLVPLALIAAIAITYGNALRGPFIFDDFNAILTNDHIKTLEPLSISMTATERSVLVGRPLICFSFAVNYAIGGYNPLGYHLFNIATHIAATLLLFGVIRRAGGATAFAGAAALLWAVHPLQAEAVSYVTQRTECLESMFLLLMLYCLARAASGWPIWRIGAILACAAGMACKEQMVVAPILAMLYDWMFLPHEASKRRARYLTYVGLMATWVVLPLELRGADWDSKTGYGLTYVHKWDYLTTQAGVILRYLRQSVWPSGQALDYFDWPTVQPFLHVVGPCLFVLALLTLSIVLCFKKRWEGFLGAWFFLILGPTSSLLPNFTEVVAERRMYLPLASVVILILAVVWQFPNWVKLVFTLTAATLLGALTIHRNHLYQDPVAIWSDTIAKRPADSRAHMWLGLALADRQDWTGAWKEDAASLRISPNLTGALNLQTFLQRHAPASRPDTLP